MTDAITKKLDGMEMVSKMLSSGRDGHMTDIPLKDVLALINVARAANEYFEENFSFDSKLGDALKKLGEV